MHAEPLRIALIGMGTVGTGVARLLTEHADRIQRRAGRPIEIARVVVRDAAKPRDISLPAGLVTQDLDAAIDDPSIDVALQLIGGTTKAREVMLRLLQSGKDVVTANKALLCDYGPEVFASAREHGRTISFEAAVAGGIPIIAAVGQSMSANQLSSIEAILNGTSNYILTEMMSTGRSYDDVLKDAQELGYAEADPTMDVDGTDAAQKLVILAWLAFGTRVSLEKFPRQGINRLQLADLKFADEFGYRIKLLAVARLVEQRLEMHVQPTLVARHRPLAETSGPFNIIALKGDAIGQAWLSGPGAGRMPTASAVVADLVDVATGRAAQSFSRLDLWREAPAFALQPAEEISRRYYIRFNVEDRPHVLADITDILGRNGISIASVIQKESTEPVEGVPLVIMTHETFEGRMRTADRELDELATILGERIRMPVDTQG